MATAKAKALPPEITEIDLLARQYADAQTDLDNLTNVLRLRIDNVVREHWYSLRKATTRAAERYEALYAAVNDSEAAFAQPKTRILHGVRVGFRKAKDTLQVLDAGNTVNLIKKHWPEHVDVMIATDERPVIDALEQLDDAQLKLIGCRRVPGTNEAQVKLADTDLDKVVQALMKSAIEKAEAGA